MGECYVSKTQNVRYDKLTHLFACPELTDTLTLETKPNGQILIRPPGWKPGGGDDSDDDIPIEELVEQQRRSLEASQCTPLTKETFYQWMEMKRIQKAQEAAEAAKKAPKKGETVTGPSGRELFSLNADLFKDDEDATSDIDYDAREEVEEGEVAKAEDVGNEAVFNADDELPDDLDD